MKTYTISKTARMFGLTRSTLLYYDRVGVLSPSLRTSSGYRLYTEDDVKRLERISVLRQTSLSIEDIKTILISEDSPSADILEKRLQEIGEEIRALKVKQQILSTMLKGVASGQGAPKVDKEMWVEMLRAAGMDSRGMERWHAEFERRAPEAHHEFLLSLGISGEEAIAIQHWARQVSFV